MSINIVNAELPNDWMSDAQLAWVTSTADEPSEGGVRAPVARQTRALQQWTFTVFWEDAIEFQDFFISVDGPANAFFVRPPLTRLYQVTGAALGSATGSSQDIQLTITRGTKTWNASYVIEAETTVYANGVPLSLAAWSLNETTGVLTVTATAGQALTIDFQWKTVFKFIGDELVTDVQTQDLEMPQQATILEVF